ncbi:MAG TPA: hypothetical protein VF950_27690 [Planctomycetota bacterium]
MLLFALQVAAWDTGKPGAPEAEWTPARTPTSFQGDAVIGNGLLRALVRKDGAGVELRGPDGALRALLSPAAGPLERLALVEVGRGAACLDVAWKTAAVKLRLKRGDVALEIEPGAGAARLRIECASRFLVLPDFFADDILIDAAAIPGSTAEIPSESFLVQPAGAGDALVMTVFENREQDVEVSLAGAGAERRIAASEVAFGKGKIWVAVLAEPRIWHAVELRAEHANKALSLDWTMPFPASWRVELTRPNGLVDSWDMLLQNKKGEEYVKPAWLGGPAEKVNDATRRRFTEVLGFFPYPAWSDPERRGYLQPLEIETRTKFVPVLSYRGPALLYPFNRVPETPSDRFTVVDVARACLGVGPCEYILDVESQKQDLRGVATCDARDLIAAIYAKGQQKERQAEVFKALDDALAFVKHIRGRITTYLEFGRKLRDFLGERKKERPELAGAIDELDRIAQEMEARFAERAEKIKDLPYVARLNDDFRKEALGADGAAKAKAYGDALTSVGGTQDKLVSECRWVARTLRQRAALLLAGDPRLAPVAAEIRTRTQGVLKNPSRHERARQ